MSIENLKKLLESEKDLAYLDWLFPKELNINNRDEAIKSNNYKRRLDYETYIVGYEAATNRLLPLLQKAIEMAEFYADGKHLTENDSEVIIVNASGILIDDHVVGRKAREFLSEFTKTTEIKNV